MSTLQFMLTLVFLHCLRAYPNPSSPSKMNFEIVEGLYKNLINVTCIESDAKFYSPSGDMSNKCIWGALSCSTAELETVKSECFTQGSKEYKYISKMKTSLNMTLQAHIKKSEDAPSCICESKQTEKPYKLFLENIRTLYQKLNSLNDA